MLFVSSFAQSAFYKCVVDGKTTFTDQPCDQNAKSEVLKNIEVVKHAPSTRSQTENTSSVERMKKAAASMYADRRKSELKKDISDKIPMSTYLELIWKANLLKEVGKLDKEKKRLLQRSKDKTLPPHKEYRKELNVLVKSKKKVSVRRT